MVFRGLVEPELAARCMRAADALLVSLDAQPALEKFVPSKLFDCCAVGRPVVLAARGEAPRLAGAADAALVVPPGDAEALAGAIRRLRDEPETGAQLARAGRAFAAEHLREDQIAVLERVLIRVASPRDERAGGARRAGARGRHDHPEHRVGAARPGGHGGLHGRPDPLPRPALSPAEYGLFALALATGLLALQPSDFGISQSMARFMADHRDDPVAVRDVFSAALRLKLVAGVAVSVALYALAGPIANAYGEPDLLWPLRVIAFAVLAQGMMNFFVTPFMALQRVSLRARVVVLESLTEFSASIALVILGGGVAGALWGRTIGYAFGAAMAAIIVARLLGWHAARSLRGGGGHLRRIASYASAMLLVEGAFTAFTQVDVIVIGAYLTTADVAFFQAPSRLTTLLAYPGLALSAGVAPRLSFGGDGPDVRSLERSLRYLLILQAAMIPPIVVWADPLTSVLLGSEYADRPASCERSLHTCSSPASPRCSRWV